MGDFSKGDDCARVAPSRHYTTAPENSSKHYAGLGSSIICGMALGGWLAGAMYDQFGSYVPAFVAGVAFNVANIALIGWLAIRLR